MPCRDHLWYLCHHGVVPGASATHLLILCLTYEDVYVCSPQTEVPEHVLIYLLHHAGPFGVAVVRLALMQENAFDHSYLLSLLRHLDDSAVRIAAIVVSGYLCPPLVRILVHLLLIQVLVEHLNGAATHGDGYDTDFLVGQGLHHRTTEIVCRTELAYRTDNRALCSVPVAQCALRRVEITSRQHLEPLIDIPHVLSFPHGITLHIGLAET